jgi:hypothetical protein
VTPLDVSATTRIALRPDEVAAYAFDPANDQHWIGGVRQIERLDTGSMAIGSQVRRLGRFLGRTIEWVMEVVALEPERRLQMHAVRSPFPMDVTYRLEPGDDGRSTTASIRIQGEARGVYALLGPLTPMIVRRSVQNDLRRLRQALETDAR